MAKYSFNSLNDCILYVNKTVLFSLVSFSTEAPVPKGTLNDERGEQRMLDGAVGGLPVALLVRFGGRPAWFFYGVARLFSG